jgi:hypothetical protein
VKVMKGDVHNGTHYHADGRVEELYEDGDVVMNPEVCDEFLPTQGGFFFGSTDYDTYYLYDLRKTIEIIDALDLDGEYKGDFYYRASW